MTAQEETTYSYYERAVARVCVEPSLAPYRDVLLDDWNMGDTHYEWVVTAGLEAVLDWAECIAAEREIRN